MGSNRLSALELPRLHSPSKAVTSRDEAINQPSKGLWQHRIEASAAQSQLFHCELTRSGGSLRDLHRRRNVMRTTQHRAPQRTRSTLLLSLILGHLIGPWVANNAVAATLPVHCDTGGTVQGALNAASNGDTIL